MPLYFFFIQGGEHLVNQEGVELGGIEEARTHALAAIAEVLREKRGHLWSGSVWTMDIVDDAGVRIGGVSFRADPI